MSANTHNINQVYHKSVCLLFSVMLNTIQRGSDIFLPWYDYEEIIQLIFGKNEKQRSEIVALNLSAIWTRNWRSPINSAHALHCAHAQLNDSIDIRQYWAGHYPPTIKAKKKNWRKRRKTWSMLQTESNGPLFPRLPSSALPLWPLVTEVQHPCAPAHLLPWPPVVVSSGQYQTTKQVPAPAHTACMKYRELENRSFPQVDEFKCLWVLITSEGTSV